MPTKADINELLMEGERYHGRNIHDVNVAMGTLRNYSKIPEKEFTVSYIRARKGGNTPVTKTLNVQHEIAVAYKRLKTALKEG